jgi:hypothetical protein
MKSSHLAMSSSLRGIDSMDYVHAQTRGPNWIQLIVNQTIYHLPIPSPNEVVKLCAASGRDRSSSTPSPATSTSTTTTTNQEVVTPTAATSSSSSLSSSSLALSSPGGSDSKINVSRHHIDIEPVDGSQLAPEWIPLSSPASRGSLLFTQLKWKIQRNSKMIVAFFVMKRTKHSLTAATTASSSIIANTSTKSRVRGKK